MVLQLYLAFDLVLGDALGSQLLAEREQGRPVILNSVLLDDLQHNILKNNFPFYLSYLNFARLIRKVRRTGEHTGHAVQEEESLLFENFILEVQHFVLQAAALVLQLLQLLLAEHQHTPSFGATHSQK